MARKAGGNQVLSKNSQEREKKTRTSSERKAFGICRDCDEEVAEDSMIFCEIHNARMREYRKKYKAKKRAEAKDAEAK